MALLDHNELTHLPLVPYICHYLNQCWLIINWTLRNKLQWNSNQNTKYFINDMHLKMSSSKWQPQSFNISTYSRWSVVCSLRTTHPRVHSHPDILQHSLHCQNMGFDHPEHTYDCLSRCRLEYCEEMKYKIVTVIHDNGKRKLPLKSQDLITSGDQIILV